MRSRQKSNEIKNQSTSILGRILVLTGARQSGKTTLVK
jgi:predicted AAA+ superfamily ATPase